ncbi:hypothetical protein [Paenibacillus popilliae]|nr:hypothetical protein [Paenibacillus popilliae]
MDTHLGYEKREKAEKITTNILLLTSDVKNLSVRFAKHKKLL